MAKYIVRLTAEERTQLTELISTGRRAASVLTRARMLLKADASEGGPHWSDQEIAEAVETSLSSIHRVRQPASRTAWLPSWHGSGPRAGSIARWTARRRPGWSP